MFRARGRFTPTGERCMIAPARTGPSRAGGLVGNPGYAIED